MPHILTLTVAKFVGLHKFHFRQMMLLFRVLILWKWSSSTRWAAENSDPPSLPLLPHPPASVPAQAGTRRELERFEPQKHPAQGVGKQNQTPGWFLLTWPASRIYHEEFKMVKVTAAWLTLTPCSSPRQLCINGESPRTLLLSRISSETFVWQDKNHSPRAGQGCAVCLDLFSPLSQRGFMIFLWVCTGQEQPLNQSIAE